LDARSAVLVIALAAVSDGLTQTNPCRVRGAGVERSAERPIVGPELVLELANPIGTRWRAMILLAGFGGLRLPASARFALGFLTHRTA
jgi:hypothetical protein